MILNIILGYLTVGCLICIGVNVYVKFMSNKIRQACSEINGDPFVTSLVWEVEKQQSEFDVIYSNPGIVILSIILWPVVLSGMAKGGKK